MGRNIKNTRNEAYLYLHKRKDTKEVFYIGIGIRKNRHLSKDNRNKYWHNIVNKVGFLSEILYTGLTWEEACIKEIELIALYGREDLGKGNLVNLTNGGDGAFGAKWTEEQKIEKSIKMTGSGNPMYGIESPNKGRKMSDETKEKIANSHRGEKCYLYGKRGKDAFRSKIVLHLDTGTFYDSCCEAAEVFGYNPNTLRCMLNGNDRNHTCLIYV